MLIARIAATQEKAGLAAARTIFFTRIFMRIFTRTGFRLAENC